MSSTLWKGKVKVFREEKIFLRSLLLHILHFALPQVKYLPFRAVLLYTVLVSVEPARKGFFFFHTYVLKRHDLCGDHEIHNALLFPGREKLIPNLLSLKTIPPTRKPLGSHVILLWTLTGTAEEQISTWGVKAGKSMVWWLEESKAQSPNTGDCFRRWRSLRGNSWRQNQQQCSADVSKLDLTSLRLLCSSNGQQGFSYFLQ